MIVYFKQLLYIKALFQVLDMIELEQIDQQKNYSQDKMASFDNIISPQQGSNKDLNQQKFHEELILEYNAYKMKQKRSSSCHKIRFYVYQMLTYMVVVLNEIWREIIPEYFRGPMVEREFEVFLNENGQKEVQLLSEYIKKRNPFYMIVFQEGIAQNQFIQAYQHAGKLLTEGLGINHEELKKKSTCHLWNIQNFNTINCYTINFFKFNLFENLIWFGSTSKAILVKCNQEQIQNLKAEITKDFKEYEQLQQNFINSSMQKQDRVHFTSIEEILSK